ncbi:MAG: hypothetical protein HY744_07215 [Deltaproteobacteria bacterium]|nr:hypothetical protein [Deltaproteobacteria bacterium]
MGDTEEETLAKLTWWAKRRLRHSATGGPDASTADNRIARAYLVDRLKPTIPNPHPGASPNRSLVEATNGCHGAAALLSDLARSVNIPLRHVLCMEDLICPPSKSFLSSVHAGLVHRWGSPPGIARILWHVDCIYAFNPLFYPWAFGGHSHSSTYEENCYPIQSTGHGWASVDDEEKRWKLFHAWWQTTAVMEKKWGFRCCPWGMGPLAPSDAYHHHKGIWVDVDVYNFGYFGGYWHRSARVDADTPSWKGIDPHVDDRVYDRSNIFDLERCYSTGAYSLVKYFQGYLVADTITYDNAQQNLAQMAWPKALPHTSEEYRTRSRDCVRAYGGHPLDDPAAATALGVQEDQWLASRGYLPKYNIP